MHILLIKLSNWHPDSVSSLTFDHMVELCTLGWKWSAQPSTMLTQCLQKLVSDAFYAETCVETA